MNLSTICCPLRYKFASQLSIASTITGPCRTCYSRFPMPPFQMAFLTPPERFCTSIVLRVNPCQHFPVHLHEEFHVRILGLNDQVVPDRDVRGAIGGDSVLELMSRYVSQICFQTAVDFGDAYEELVMLPDFQ